VTCERFASGNSILHRSDPRVKILLAAGFAVVTAVIETRTGQVLALLGGMILILSGGLLNRELFRRMAWVNFFLLMLWFILPVTTPGNAAAKIWSLDISREGLELALSVTLKCNAIVLANIALLSTSTIFAIAHALAHLNVPSRLVQLFFFSWRYFHVIYSEFRRLRRAAGVRGFEPATDMHTYMTYAHMIGMLFIRSLERGERVYKAMLCRGFDGTFWLLTHFHLHRRDFFLAFVSSAYILAIAGVEWL